MADRLKIRLSRPYDYDLYCLYLSIGKKEFSKITRKILSSYINKEEFEPEEITNWVIPEAGDKGIAVTCNLSFDKESGNIIQELQKIPEGKRGSFVKTLIRIYYAEKLLPVYFNRNTNIGEVAKRPKKKITKNKEVPDIEQIEDANNKRKEEEAEIQRLPVEAGSDNNQEFDVTSFDIFNTIQEESF